MNPHLKRKSIVPMPASKVVYGEGGTKRDQLIRQYGEVSVMHAEVAVCVTVMVELGIIRQSEFVQLIENALQAADYQRHRQAQEQATKRD